MNTKEFLDALQQRVEAYLNEVERLQPFGTDTVEFKRAMQKWHHAIELLELEKEDFLGGVILL